MGKKMHFNLGKALALLVLFYMLIPIFIIYFVSFDSASYFSFPPKEGLSLVHYQNALKSEEYQSAVKTSLMVAATAVCIGLLVGIPAAFAIDRFEFPGKNLVQGALLAPLMLPHIIWAIGLVSLYANFKLSGTFIGMVFAHAILVTPYVIRLVLSSLAFININLEDAAKNLGASPRRTFFEITMPLISPGILVSAMFGFTLSFTDTVIATFIAGSRLITFPARMYYEQRTEGLDPLAVAVSAMVISVIIIIALVGERTVNWSRYI